MTEQEMIRQQMETAIATTVKTLKYQLSVNASRRPEERAQTVTEVAMDGDRFLVVGGSAHQMGDCFREMFRRRPELVSVVRNVILEMFAYND